MKPEFVYKTGREYDINDYSSPEAFSRYAHRQLGVEVPVITGRMVWYQKLKAEMEAHGWTWEDMAKTVRYMKAHNIHANSIYYVLYHVQKAETWAEEIDEWELHGKVADALREEQDESWRRKLSLAKGKALERVYEQWMQTRTT